MLRRTIALTLAALFAPTLAFWGARAGEFPPPDAARVERAVGLAVEYLLTNAQANGEFTYRRSLTRRYRYKYNVLRHAGAVYALAQARAAARERPGAFPFDEEKARLTINRACDFLRRCLHPVQTNSDMLAVWSAEEKMDIRAFKGSPLVAKLGASGLGILALFAEEAPKENAVTAARRIGVFILSMQRPDGSFVSRTIAGKTDEDDFDSLYYPGEAMLGLLALYERDPDPRWLVAAVKAMRCLADARKAKNQYPPDHWALLASTALWRLRGQWLPGGPGAVPPAVAAGLTEGALCGHAAMICEGMLQEQWRMPCFPGEDGCFRVGGLTCPTATRVEGMLAARDFLPLPAYGGLRARILDSCTAAVAFLLKAQYPDGVLRGGVPRSSTADVLRDAPGERARADEVRIDYVQHALSAFVAYRRAMGW